MGYVIDPTVSTRDEIQRLVRERLGDAVDRLDAIIGGDDVDIEKAVHEVRKRCKETRGVARLVRPAIGAEFATFNQLVRDGASQLSEMRDAHALLATFDTLLDAQVGGADRALRSVRDHQATLAADATAAITSGDERIFAARRLLGEALDRSQHWDVGSGFATIGNGLADTYRRGRRSLRTAERTPDDHQVHEWRKAVKYLWYQCRLLKDAAPSVLEPMVEQLDALGGALGDDHDLAVLVERLDADATRFGGPDVARAARELATSQQDELRKAAFRAGATIYVEPPAAFRSRVKQYWRATVDRGPEGPVGGIAELAAERAHAEMKTVGRTASPEPSPSTVERERKFLVSDLPPDVDVSNGADMRQGYLSPYSDAEDGASVRVRETAGHKHVLTVKAGGGRERTELEWPMSVTQFEAAWPHTEGRRITKVRHRISFEDHVVELDVFTGFHDGLRVAEVEFDSTAEMDAFEPPAWFGREVTDDGRYTNAALALHGLPADPP